MCDDFKVFIAVRLKSKRLKRKALLDLGGQPAISILIEKLLSKFTKDKIVLCTSELEVDDDLVDLCKTNSIQFFRGPPDDVMGRFLLAETSFPASRIVRVTGDNPLTDPTLIQKMLQHHKNHDSEYTFTNSFPIGTRAEIIETSALKRIHKQLMAPENSEYMTYMLNRPDKLRIECYQAPEIDKTYPNVSVTLDNQEDYERLKSIFLYSNNRIPSTDDLMAWCRDNHQIHPKLSKNNAPEVDLALYGYRDDFKY